MKEFENFVASPYFSRGRDLKPFYKILKSNHPNFNNGNFTYEKIFRKLNPKVKYIKSKSENLLRVMSSELVKLAEEYLTLENLKKAKLWFRINLIDAYLAKNLKTFYSKLYSETESNPSKLVDGLSSKYFIDLYFLKMYDVAIDLRDNNKLKVSFESQFALLNFFFLCAENFIENAFVAKNTFNVDCNDNIVEQFMRCFDGEKFIKYLDNKKDIKKSDKELLELCFYSVLLSLDHYNEKYVAIIERLFYKNRHLFRDDHKLTFYYLLYPAFIQSNNLDKLYLLYMNMLTDKIFEPGKGLPMAFIMYFNILHLLAEKKLKEAEKFAIKYVNSLNTEKKEIFLNYSSALIEFKRKNFGSALEYISKVEINFYFFKYHSKILFLQIYYELGYYEEAISLIDSFKHFLKNNRNVSDMHKTNYTNFVHYYSKLLNMKLSDKRTDAVILKKKISVEEKLLSKSWFLEKINEM